MRGGGGEGVRDGVTNRIRVDCVGGERSNRPPAEQGLASTTFECLGGSQPEQIVFAAAQQGGGVGAVVDR
ncbi:hypothetical protein SRABI91_03903 [Rhodococcoides fascians]|nr:hypothetical protein SRABI91_03903 [Rhodococcus fascians]